MKKSKLFLASLFVIFSFSIFALGQNEKTDKTKKTDSNYDAELAKKFGADDYGMKQYVFVILKTGTAKIDDEEKKKKLLTGHMENINRLADAGKLVLAGPFMEGGNMRGLFIFNVTTIEEAKELEVESRRLRTPHECAKSDFQTRVAALNRKIVAFNRKAPSIGVHKRLFD